MEVSPIPASRFALPKRASGVLDSAQRERALAIVQALVSTPTAPYAEDGLVQLLVNMYAGREGFDVLVDEHANLVVVWTGGPAKRGGPKRVHRTLAFSAHLDHPGFLVEGRRQGHWTASFHGGVPAKLLPGATVRFYKPGRSESVATATVGDQLPTGRMVFALSKLRGRLAKGCFGVFDQPHGVMRGSRLHARVCDDLLGVAAIVSTLEALADTNHPARVAGIFTRAEETGFVGCIGLLQAQGLLTEVDVIGLECSPKRPFAKVGSGPVVRVGDKRSVFDPYLSLELSAAAERLEARVPGFRWQRALMDGGSCESTAYNLWGVRAGAACLALGNYHNCGPAGRLEPEFVDWNDYEGLVALLQEMAVGRLTSESPTLKLQTRLQGLYDSQTPRLALSAKRILSSLEERTT